MFHLQELADDRSWYLPQQNKVISLSISSLAVDGGPQKIRMATHSFNSANPGRDPANKTSVSTVNDPNHVQMSSANIKQSGLFDSCGVNKESPGV